MLCFYVALHASSLKQALGLDNIARGLSDMCVTTYLLAGNKVENAEGSVGKERGQGCRSRDEHEQGKQVGRSGVQGKGRNVELCEGVAA
jgi:hypothetical protein